MRVRVSSLKTRSWSYLLSWWLVFCPQCMCRDDWWRGRWEEWIQIPGPLQLLKNGAAVTCWYSRQSLQTRWGWLHHPAVKIPSYLPEWLTNSSQEPPEFSSPSFESRCHWMGLSNCFLMNTFSDLWETSKKNIALRSEVVKIWIL